MLSGSVAMQELAQERVTLGLWLKGYSDSTCTSTVWQAVASGLQRVTFLHSEMVVGCSHVKHLKASPGRGRGQTSSPGLGGHLGRRSRGQVRSSPWAYPSDPPLLD